MVIEPCAFLPRTRLATERQDVSEPMFCQRCYYNLKATVSGTCPECGQAFDASDPATFSEYAVSPWHVRVLKFFIVFDRWWFYAAATVCHSLVAVFATSLWMRIEFGLLAVLSVWCTLRSLVRGSVFQKALADTAR